MGKFCQIVVGPAGSGKSTYCAILQDHFSLLHRTVNVFNFDPASETIPYSAAVDIREFVSVQDVMEYCSLGPNGALVYALEYALSDPLQQSWLDDALGDYPDDYLLIDFAGQVELFTYYDCIGILSRVLQTRGYTVLLVYIAEAQKFQTRSSYLSTVLVAMSAMSSCGTAFLPVMSKVDLLGSELQARLFGAGHDELQDLVASMAEPRTARTRLLDAAIEQAVVAEGGLCFVPYTATEPETVHAVAARADLILGFGEDEEPPNPPDLE
ncbi:ATP/GTP-binding protein [Giardia duodenalis]|uniref:GPN-loop GTPase 3 n=1 Tax=Giardia intestinalis TaxID=5741 RepID=V6TKW4_GIAIN|nr:ATP/GTP-binding protein [Giardia intestinalis]